MLCRKTCFQHDDLLSIFLCLLENILKIIPVTITELFLMYRRNKNNCTTLCLSLTCLRILKWHFVNGEEVRFDLEPAERKYVLSHLKLFQKREICITKQNNVLYQFYKATIT
uniref:Uncharacterized protein n=1 Tax=Octopus bimaculoides TaxID=37653 RepID=A0A0L8HRF3_OCTBM